MLWQCELARLAQDGSIAWKIRLRARIILLSEEMPTAQEVARATKTCVLTVRKWRSRFEAQGLEGLLTDAPRPGRPRKIDAALRERILAQAGRASTRMLAAKLGLSRSAVHRVLQGVR